MPKPELAPALLSTAAQATPAAVTAGGVLKRRPRKVGVARPSRRVLRKYIRLHWRGAPIPLGVVDALLRDAARRASACFSAPPALQARLVSARVSPIRRSANTRLSSPKSASACTKACTDSSARRAERQSKPAVACLSTSL